MHKNLVVMALLAMILTVSVPALVARGMRLGSVAKSPQKVELSAGSRTIVAGGRACLWFGCGSSGRMFELQRGTENRAFEPGLNEPCEAFGVTVKLLEVAEAQMPRAKFQVSWEQ